MVEEWAQNAGLYLYDRRVWVKDPCWENGQWHSLSYRSVDEFEYVYVFWKPGINTVDRTRLTRAEWSEWGSRGVWHIPSVRANVEHEAQFPEELPRRVIRIFTAADDMVLDCFVGSGTTSIVAIREGRRYLGIELMPHYAALASERCRNAQKRAQSWRSLSCQSQPATVEADCQLACPDHKTRPGSPVFLGRVIF